MCNEKVILTKDKMEMEVKRKVKGERKGAEESVKNLYKAWRFWHLKRGRNYIRQSDRHYGPLPFYSNTKLQWPP